MPLPVSQRKNPREFTSPSKGQATAPTETTPEMSRPFCTRSKTATDSPLSEEKMPFQIPAIRGTGAGGPVGPPPSSS